MPSLGGSGRAGGDDVGGSGNTSGGLGGESNHSSVGDMDAHERGVRGGYKNAAGTPGTGDLAGGNAGSTSVHDHEGNLVGVYDNKGRLVGKPTGIGNGVMTTTAGWQHGVDPGGSLNPYGIGDPRNSNHRGYLAAKRGIAHRASSVFDGGWKDLQYTMQKQGLSHVQQEAYRTAYSNGQWDSIPDSIMSASAKQAVKDAVDTMNGPFASAFGLTQTPHQAINDLARDLTFSDLEGKDLGDSWEDGNTVGQGGRMGLKPSAVYGTIFGDKMLTGPAGALAMGVGPMVGGIGGKMTSLLGQMVLTPGPTEVLEMMGRTLNLAYNAQVAGVDAPERSSFSPDGGAVGTPFVQPVNVASAATQTARQPSAANAVSFSPFSPYNGYGYTLI